MNIIKSAHNLLDQPDTTVPARATDSGRSSYFYLFRPLADANDAGRFRADEDEERTVARLKDLEKALRIGAAADEAQLMHLPAAYTYFGQFLNHDISAPTGGLFVDVGSQPPAGVIGTADPAGVGKEFRKDIATILEHFVNEHTRPITLASLYGDGPDSDDREVRDLYEDDCMRFRIGETSHSTAEELARSGITPAGLDCRTGAKDILRLDGVPQIADRRNDGNLILSQLHLAFLAFHNHAVTKLVGTFPTEPATCFREARKLVTLHYHWLILNDYLPSILSKSVLAKPLADWTVRPTANRTENYDGLVPMEFTTAAFRFGHSMVGKTYDFNENFGSCSKIGHTGATLTQLFDFTSRGKMGLPENTKRQLPDHWVIDWDRMTLPPRPGSGGAEEIDLTFAANMLSSVGEEQVTEHGSILFRNLLRGFHRRIPFGQVLAREYGLEELDPEAICAALPRNGVARPDGYATIEPPPGMTLPEFTEALGIDKETPAWLYFLCEAKAIEAGERVGPTASHIIADTIVGLMRRMPQSLLQPENARWHPKDSPLKGPGDTALTTLRDFLLYTQTLTRG